MCDTDHPGCKGERALATSQQQDGPHQAARLACAYRGVPRSRKFLPNLNVYMNRTLTMTPVQQPQCAFLNYSINYYFEGGS